ncbi:RNase H domain-containing protein [Trichonephila clavipes]|nr:RNase H domain-containing protein [Trichonephila clavipes]
MDSIWILTDSRRFIQHLKNWQTIIDCSGPDIISELAKLGQRKQVCLQWIPSHVGVPGNEAANELTGRAVTFVASWLGGYEVACLPRKPKDAGSIPTTADSFFYGCENRPWFQERKCCRQVGLIAYKHRCSFSLKKLLLLVDFRILKFSDFELQLTSRYTKSSFRSRPKSVNFHDAKNRQRSCRMIMRFTKYPLNAFIKD